MSMGSHPILCPRGAPREPRMASPLLPFCCGRPRPGELHLSPRSGGIPGWSPPPLSCVCGGAELFRPPPLPSSSTAPAGCSRCCSSRGGGGTRSPPPPSSPSSSAWTPSLFQFVVVVAEALPVGTWAGGGGGGGGRAPGGSVPFRIPHTSTAGGGGGLVAPSLPVPPPGVGGTPSLAPMLPSKLDDGDDVVDDDDEGGGKSPLGRLLAKVSPELFMCGGGVLELVCGPSG
jgi:hypothetical protein